MTSSPPPRACPKGACVPPWKALRHAELIIARELSAERYSFKHALVRDAAYAGLLKSRRVQLHAAIARAIEQSFAHLAETEPETLAYHLTEAGLHEKAAGYWLRAGKIAVGRYANIEAIAHLRRGIEALSSFADGATGSLGAGQGSGPDRGVYRA